MDSFHLGNLGDGISQIAIALLAAPLTRDPLAVAMVTALSYLPWLAFGLPAGVLVDRHDRCRLLTFNVANLGSPGQAGPSAARQDRHRENGDRG